MPVHRENDKTATVLFSYAVIYWTLFGISRYLHIGGPDVSRRLVRLRFYTSDRLFRLMDRTGKPALHRVGSGVQYNCPIVLPASRPRLFPHTTFQEHVFARFGP
jgi:phosphatidylinositol glycan class W